VNPRAILVDASALRLVAERNRPTIGRDRDGLLGRRIRRLRRQNYVTLAVADEILCALDMPEAYAALEELPRFNRSVWTQAA
jgi:hypothetical protein